jgi:hypothetical protein
MTIKEYMSVKNLYDLHEGNSKKIVKGLLEMNKDLKLKDANKKVLNYFEELNNTPKDLVQRFRHNGVEYGLIPDFEEMLTKEYLDIDKYEKDFNQIHRLMAVMYRPITKSKGDKYDIEDYEGTSKYSDIMLEVEVGIYQKLMGFFLSLNQILLKDIQISTEKMMKKRVVQEKKPQVKKD